MKKGFLRVIYEKKIQSLIWIIAGEVLLFLLISGWQESVQKPVFAEKPDLLLPELYILSANEYTDITREEYVSCKCTLTNTKRKYCFSIINGQIKGRGNSTWEEFNKKPYKIKFDRPQDLLGMGADRDWVLLSNPLDYTMLRNEIGFGIAEILDMEYTPKSQWCHLYWNDEYLGIYQLCEPVETGRNRVNIEADSTSNKNYVGYFLEIGGGVEGVNFEPVGREHDWGEYCNITVLYPGEDIITEAERENAYTYLQWVNSVILNKDWAGINALVDVDSFVNWYLTNEIMLNTDMGWSMFAYIPEDNKLHLGPVWDFDQSCGISTLSGSGVETWTPCPPLQNAWFETLMEMDEFRELLYVKWMENKEEIALFLAMEQEKASYYQNDINANFERWDVLGELGGWRMTEDVAKLETYEENTAYLFDWLQRRTDWMDSEIRNYK